MTKVLNLNHVIWPWWEFIIIEELLILPFYKKTPDVKFLFEQSLSISYLPYHNLQQLIKGSCFCNPQVPSFQDESFLANKLKSWRTLSYSLGRDELQTQQLFIISTKEKLNILKSHMSVEIIFQSYLIIFKIIK